MGFSLASGTSLTEMLLAHFAADLNVAPPSNCNWLEDNKFVGCLSMRLAVYHFYMTPMTLAHMEMNHHGSQFGYQNQCNGDT
jgi:hypothetical protein